MKREKEAYASNEISKEHDWERNSTTLPKAIQEQKEGYVVCVCVCVCVCYGSYYSESVLQLRESEKQNISSKASRSRGLHLLESTECQHYKNTVSTKA